MPEHPTTMVIFDRGFNQRIACETAPRFQFGTNIFFGANNRDQIARVAAAQSCYQLWQQARCKRFAPDIQIDVCLHRNTEYFTTACGTVDSFDLRAAQQ